MFSLFQSCLAGWVLVPLCDLDCTFVVKITFWTYMCSYEDRVHIPVIII